MDKILGVILISTACLVIVGMLLHIMKLWFFIDIVVIAVCGVAGVVLLKKNNG